MGRQLVGVRRAKGQAGDDEPGDVAPASESEPGSSGDGTTATVDVQSWVDSVKNTIPVEVVTAWAAIEALIGTDGGVFASSRYLYLGLVAVMAVVTALHMWVDVETPTADLARSLGVPLRYLRHSQYAQILLAVGAFLVWVYYLGGLYGRDVQGLRLYYPEVAKVLLPLYVVVGPELVPNVLRKLHGVDVPDDEQRPPAEVPERGSDG